MNKKGFTLVEILAVISIMAILLILLVPNVLETFKSSKRNNFLSEAHNVYKAATNQYIIDRAQGYYEVVYERGTNIGTPANKRDLDLSSRDGYNFTVRINTDGEVDYFYVEDYDFKIELNQSNIKLGDITDDTIESESIGSNNPTPTPTPDPTISCDAGYYLKTSNNTCTQCTRDYYCPGDNNRYLCPDGKTSIRGATSESECINTFVSTVINYEILESSNATNICSYDSFTFYTSDGYTYVNICFHNRPTLNCNSINVTSVPKEVNKTNYEVSVNCELGTNLHVIYDYVFRLKIDGAADTVSVFNSGDEIPLNNNSV